MSSTSMDRLYELLPAIYRNRDAVEGEPLRALLAIMDEQRAAIEADIALLYDNWFIETCQEWVVPYIADLLGIRGLRPGDGTSFSRRALVANTVGYRRRKGTAAMLEQLARDITAWPAHAVEYFQRISTTQHVNHVRLDSFAFASLRNASDLELVDSPFETVTHTGEVRHIDNERGRYNIPNVGIFFWRLQSYALVRADARLVTPAADAGYTFHPVGLDAPLFNQPQTESEITHLAEESDVPAPLRRRPLFDELNQRRAAITADRTPDTTYFGAEPVLRVYLDGEVDPLPPEAVMICNLQDWHRPVAATYTPRGEPEQNARVVVDPVLGRATVPDGQSPPARLEVGYTYGAPGDLGGGPYDRRASVDAWLESVDFAVTFQVGVTAAPPLGQDDLVATLADAAALWNDQPAGTIGMIVIMDSRSYAENLTGPNTIRIPSSSRLLIVAGDWVADEDAPAAEARRVGQVLPQERRPHLQGDVHIVGTAAESSAAPGYIDFDGLLIEGGVRVGSGNLGRVRLAHCTLVPSASGLQVDAGNERLDVVIERCVTGRISAADANSLRLENSMVQPTSGVALRGPDTVIEAVTVLGTTEVETLQASNSIFAGRVTVERRQTGCVRYSWLPTASRAPRRYQCIPTSAAQERSLTPEFTSPNYGHPAYGQLALTCPVEIMTGADDGGEQGAWHFLRQTQRIADLRASLDEYLRVGLEAGVFFVT